MLHSYAFPVMLLIERRIAASQWSECEYCWSFENFTREIALRMSVRYYDDKNRIFTTYYKCFSILFPFNRQPIHHHLGARSKHKGNRGRSRDAR